MSTQPGTWAQHQCGGIVLILNGFSSCLWLLFVLDLDWCLYFWKTPLQLEDPNTLTQYAHFDRNFRQNMTSICCYCLDPEWLFFMLVIALCIGFGLMPLLLKNTFDSVKQDQSIFTYTNKPIEYFPMNWISALEVNIFCAFNPDIACQWS